ncbi:hypothetical protein HYPBUDRAFT_141087 [Hyphopichia burtonii NRRL Y-1933]|uniref:Pyoverdine/dityrosine biosynthesis protein n=1 Tax=Hyphopichia burtonii NRRL Y-1933 TaxID=984485 RepID=A0A1E4RH19_9ASCO|nr:hypothetical protein HYPBUDRAFT_141087 [Hyphopichia burtonii NRRL Y-1933]ODV66559.1 hypothetical protein HYPBUDRAFT_141087 [Hyphopichia burtonii NRRL Y-1933]
MTTSDLENHHKTIFEKIHCLYARNKDNVLSKRTFKKEYSLEEIIKLVNELELDEQDGLLFRVNNEESIVWEMELKNQDVFVGVITDNDMGEYLEVWFIRLILDNSKIFLSPVVRGDVENLKELIATTFEEHLKYSTIGEKWNEGGKDLFKENVGFFVSKNLPIEAVLPAFPCKSSNKDKVAGWKPDKGEELSLKKIISFAQTIKKVYEPGIIVWIVSDGHVFSDCINVDDNVVDEYGEELKKLYTANKPHDLDCIKFAALKDIFKSNTLETVERFLHGFEILYHLDTKIDRTTEIYRKLLIKTCDVESRKLQNDIKTPNHPRLKLYRGFMKFMETDLNNTGLVQQVSRKKFKKIVSQVAFEMIKRNDAYSNLVELFFPFHVRFSIHAHNNSGPKFAVSLLPKSSCKTLESLDIDKNNVLVVKKMDDYLHIPTPWHNSVLQVEGIEGYIIDQAGSIRSLIASSGLQGSWNEAESCYQLSNTAVNRF